MLNNLPEDYHTLSTIHVFIIITITIIIVIINKEIFVTDKGLRSKIYKQLIQLNI